MVAVLLELQVAHRDGLSKHEPLHALRKIDKTDSESEREGTNHGNNCILTVKSAENQITNAAKHADREDTFWHQQSL